MTYISPNVSKLGHDIFEVKAAAGDWPRKLVDPDDRTKLRDASIALLDPHAGPCTVEFRTEQYLDLDHFKDVNDTLGHPIGDSLVQVVGKELRSQVRETDAVARFGGDEFAVLETDIDNPSDAAVVAAKILESLSKPFPIAGNEIHTGASIGIAVLGDDAPDEETLLSHADVAPYRAKATGRCTYRFFTDAMDREVRRTSISSPSSAAPSPRRSYCSSISRGKRSDPTK